MSAPNRRADRGANTASSSQTIFLQDTVEVQFRGHALIGVIVSTWHDLEEEDHWDVIDAAIPSARTMMSHLRALQKDGIPPKEYALFVPSAPDFQPMLVHESECKLLDRTLTFGDVVKKSLTSEMSGNVIAVQTRIGLRHAYLDPSRPMQPIVMSDTTLPDVPEEELQLAHDWNEGDFVIYKNAWMGVIQEMAPPHQMNVQWICQNMMVSGKFVPIPEPDNWLHIALEEPNLRKFRRSTGGFKKVDGSPMTRPEDTQCGGDLEVGDRVRFRDLAAAKAKYPGRVGEPLPPYMLPLPEYDSNVFVVYEAHTKVRVLWQDGTESEHDSKDVVPYLNLDEHEVWPGEVVTMKPETPAIAQTSAPPTQSLRLPQIMPGGGAAGQSGPVAVNTANVIKEKVGVVATVEPSARLARVRWFKAPVIPESVNYTMAGTRTGDVEEQAEDVSLYEIVPHPALAFRRGDIALISPADQPVDIVDLMKTSTGTVPEGGLEPKDLTPEQREILFNNLRVGNAEARLMLLDAAIDDPTHPQYPVLKGFLTTFPNLLQPQLGRPGVETTDEPAQDPTSGTPEWIGEVVDLGSDGLVTLRLGALDELRDVRVPIERLYLIHADEDNLLGPPENPDDVVSLDDGWDDAMSEDFYDPPVLSEVITYEGDAPADPGLEDDWETDGSGDSDVDMNDADAPVADRTNPEANGDPVPRTPPPVPENMPPPEAITLPANSSTPPRFEILDTPVPSTHALISQPETTQTKDLTKRIMREYKILASSLPEGIFVRTWESRLDLFRVLIVGPRNTPYELAPFLFDFHFPSTFPNAPPVGFFHSWTNGIGRVNPNLYDDGTGKVCLSLLGTWHADRGEGWLPGKSTVLQVLVSIMGLVLVREPWYNEAGFSIYEGAKEAKLNSQLYSEKAYMLSRRFVRHVMFNPIEGFENVVSWLYTERSREEEGEEGKRPELLRKVVEKGWVVVNRGIEGKDEEWTVENTEEGVGRLSKGAEVMMKRDLEVLGRVWEETAKAEEKKTE